MCDGVDVLDAIALTAGFSSNEYRRHVTGRDENCVRNVSHTSAVVAGTPPDTSCEGQGLRLADSGATARRLACARSCPDWRYNRCGRAEAPHGGPPHARNKRTQVDTRADLCARRWRHTRRKVTPWRAARPRPAWRHPPAAVIWWGAHTNAHAWRLARPTANPIHRRCAPI
jgi:hypothetical protein